MTREHMILLAKMINANMDIVHGHMAVAIGKCKLAKLEEEAIEKGFEIPNADMCSMQGDAANA